jgi:hypothetical protein
VLQDVQFVNELLQVAQGEVQGLHTDPDWPNPVGQFWRQLLKYK